MTELAELSYEIGDLAFGRGTLYPISSVDFGVPDLTAGTISSPRADGLRFGRDYYQGRTITFQGNIWTRRSNPGSRIAALDALEAIQTAWQPDDVRMTPGAVVQLRMRRGDRSRCVFGRPGRFATTTGRTTMGWIPFTCQFDCVDHYIYDDAENQHIIPFIPDSLGGLIGPLIGPIISSPPGVGSGLVPITGSKPSWMTYRIQGPIIDPQVEVTDVWKAKLNLTLASDRYVVVDPVPWSRSVRMDDGSNAAGLFTADSVRLSSMRLSPGNNEVVLRGTDPTGTASVIVYWRNTYSSY